MRGKWALAALPIALIVGCGSSAFNDDTSDTSSSSATPAERAQSIDGNIATVDTYQAALDALNTCSSSADELVDFAHASSVDEHNHGISESVLSVLTHTQQSRGGTDISDCKGVMVAYVTLREGG